MRAALLSLAALALAACGGSGAGRALPPLPSGFARYEAQGVAFSHPAAWRRDGDSSAGGDLVEFYGAPGAGGFPPQVALGSAPARDPLADVVRLHEDLGRIRHHAYRVTEDRAVDLPGAAGAHLVTAEYELQRPGREPARVREVDLLVRTRDGRQLDFFVRAPVADFDRAGLGRVLDSFRLR